MRKARGVATGDLASAALEVAYPGNIGHPGNVTITLRPKRHV